MRVRATRQRREPRATCTRHPWHTPSVATGGRGLALAPEHYAGLLSLAGVRRWRPTHFDAQKGAAGAARITVSNTRAIRGPAVLVVRCTTGSTAHDRRARQPPASASLDQTCREPEGDQPSLRPEHAGHRAEDAAPPMALGGGDFAGCNTRAVVVTRRPRRARTVESVKQG